MLRFFILHYLFRVLHLNYGFIFSYIFRIALVIFIRYIYKRCILFAVGLVATVILILFGFKKS